MFIFEFFVLLQTLFLVTFACNYSACLHLWLPATPLCENRSKTSQHLHIDSSQSDGSGNASTMPARPNLDAYGNNASINHPASPTGSFRSTVSRASSRASSRTSLIIVPPRETLSAEPSSIREGRIMKKPRTLSATEELKVRACSPLKVKLSGQSAKRVC